MSQNHNYIIIDQLQDQLYAELDDIRIQSNRCDELVEACWKHIMKPHNFKWWQFISEYNRNESDKLWYVQVEYWQAEGGRLAGECYRLEQKYRDKVMKIERPFWPEHIRDIMDEQGY